MPDADAPAPLAPPSQPGPALDQIELRGLHFIAAHGVLPHEHDHPQPFEVDIDVQLDLRKPGRSDALSETVDYGLLCEAARSVVEGPPTALVEHLAQRIADGALRACEGRALSVTVTVRKLHPPVPVQIASVGVRITRP